MPIEKQILKDLLQQGYRYALSLSQHAHTAEDLVQSALLNALKCEAPINKAYLFTSIRNTFFNQYRRDKLVPMVSYEEQDSSKLENAWDQIEWVDDGQEIDKALATLRSVEREVIFLAYVEGFSASEIAQLTSMSRGTVLSLMDRAKRKLRIQLTAGREEVAL